MKITLSKNQWEMMGKKAGWIKKAFDFEDNDEKNIPIKDNMVIELTDENGKEIKVEVLIKYAIQEEEREGKYVSNPKEVIIKNLQVLSDFVFNGKTYKGGFSFPEELAQHTQFGNMENLYGVARAQIEEGLES